MSVQHVNLYLPELRPKRPWLTAESAALILVGFVVILAGYGLSSGQQLETQGQQLDQLGAQIDETLQRIQVIRSRARPTEHQALDNQFVKLNASIYAREQLAELMLSQDLGNQAGFSSVLQALARQSLDSIALEHFRFVRGGELIELKGRCKQPEDIPLYLQKLKTEESLQGAAFGVFSIEKDSSGRGHQFVFGFSDTYLNLGDQRQ